MSLIMYGLQLADWALQHPSQATCLVIVRIMGLRVHYLGQDPSTWTRDQAKAFVFEDRSDCYNHARQVNGLMLLLDVRDGTNGGAP
jgi:hypothetical protein